MKHNQDKNYRTRAEQAKRKNDKHQTTKRNRTASKEVTRLALKGAIHRAVDLT